MLDFESAQAILVEMTASTRKPQTWVPHPDDVDDVRAAMEDVVAGRLLSAEQSAEFHAWLEGKIEKPAWLAAFE